MKLNSVQFAICIRKLKTSIPKRKNLKKLGEYIYYNPECKECTKLRSMKWQEDNPEQQYILARRREARQDRKEKTRAFAKKQRENGYQKEYQENNKDKLKGYRIKYSENKKHEITNKEWKECKEYFNNCCAYCGLSEKEHIETYNQRLHKEHVKNKGANDLSNCMPACRSCNSQKSAMEIEEWYNENNEIYSKKRLSKISK